MIDMKMGDLVEPNDTINSPLQKFGHTFVNAVIYNVCPFILITQNTNFIFKGLDSNDFKVIGDASRESLINIIYSQQRKIAELKLTIKDDQQRRVL